MNYLRHIHHITQKWVLGPIWHIIWPRRCCMCLRVLDINEQHICPECLSQLPKTEEAIHRDNLLEQRFSDDNKFVRGAAYCFYPADHPIRNAMHHFKYGHQPEIGQLLARMAADEWKDTGFFEGIDIIMPLPLHPKRLRERGYNQAEWIARGISEITHIPIDTTHMVRTVNNDRQSLKTLEERKKLGNIFAVNHPEDLRGKHILLIDDVITSGSTMRTAIAPLHAIRGCHYSVFSLAVARNQQ